ncbi:hypothetical protein J4467_03435 [Candidatus Woesearchaeota archaeon]|nr:hypothetical protein [Candidatus Woesearchaeota archaeon]
MKTKTHTTFCEFLGHSPEAKIMEYLFRIKDKMFTFNDIVTAIDVNRQRAYEVLRFLLGKNFIKEVETIKNIHFYKLNLKCTEVKSLKAFFEKVLK